MLVILIRLVIHFVATIAYRFESSRTGREKDLIENPLGFKVIAYRTDAEMGGQGMMNKVVALSLIILTAISSAVIYHVKVSMIVVCVISRISMMML